MRKEVRAESDIFTELAKLCTSPGYIHAIAYFCYRDNTVKYSSDKITVDDVLQQYSMERLVRTEISTLIGLSCNEILDTTIPSTAIMQNYIVSTDALLKEIHLSMMPRMSETPDSKMKVELKIEPKKNISPLREAIFYGGESAFHFQYRDLSAIKYEKDNEWLIKNKNYSVSQAIKVITSIQLLQNHKINVVLSGLPKLHPDNWSFLEAYKFTAEEISNNAGVSINTAKRIIDSFVPPVGMDEFKSLDDFNPKNAYPITQLPTDEYLLFQNYSLVEALYETPFFWFNTDKQYRNTAMRHRGEFTEEFSTNRLKLVFGAKRVFQNVDIYDSKKNKAGEIDVLVVFANRAIVLQAKSKRLTIAARKGNDSCLQDDFKKAIQDSYNQALSCSLLLNNPKYKLIDQNGVELDIAKNYEEIYPLCVVSDHYPALSFQSRQFLEWKKDDIIKPPFVMDVFFLDVVTEMLRSPLYFLSYVNRRTAYGDRILSTHELTILSYHLKQNLWVDDEYSMMMLGDDICADLDLAMLTRRDGIEGKDTPEGILTKYKGTFFSQILHEIENLENPAIVNLGFMLLTLNGDTIETMNDGVNQLLKLGKKDKNHHDLTLLISDDRSGITIHCNNDDELVAVPRLEQHCERRKYAQKADTWFGICIATNTRLKFGVNINSKWTHSSKMDELVKDLPQPQRISGKRKLNFKTEVRKTKKIGRNENCPCGSGKKYKKCCLV